MTDENQQPEEESLEDESLDQDSQEFQEEVEEHLQKEEEEDLQDASQFQQETDAYLQQEQDNDVPRLQETERAEHPDAGYTPPDSPEVEEIELQQEAESLQSDIEFFEPPRSPKFTPPRVSHPEQPRSAQLRQEIHVTVSPSEDLAKQIAEQIEPMIQDLYRRIVLEIEDALDERVVLLEQGKTIG